MAVVAEIVYNHLPAISKKLPGVVGRIVQETLFEIEGTAKVLVRVDTGNLRASIQTEMESETRGSVYTAVSYAPFQEYGTYKMPAAPFMTPAAEQARPHFMDKLRNLEASLG